MRSVVQIAEMYDLDFYVKDNFIHLRTEKLDISYPFCYGRDGFLEIVKTRILKVPNDTSD